MAKADCETCEALGYRACDGCGGPVMDGYRSPLGVDLCGYCR